MLNDSRPELHGEPQRPTPPPASPDAAATPSPAGTALDGEPADGERADHARTSDEYTEAPGSHRRPSDGAALDVGG